MGVETQSDCDGQHPVEMLCEECSQTFWTDETMNNTCPECGHMTMQTA